MPPPPLWRESLIGDVANLQLSNDRVTGQVAELSAQFTQFQAEHPEREAPAPSTLRWPRTDTIFPNTHQRQILVAVDRPGSEAASGACYPSASAPTPLPVVGSQVSDTTVTSTPAPRASQKARPRPKVRRLRRSRGLRRRLEQSFLGSPLQYLCLAPPHLLPPKRELAA